MLYSGPLFTHQLSHLWIDFRGIRDAFMREHGSDYFENSRQATFVHQEYAIRNPARIRRLRRILLGDNGDPTDPGGKSVMINSVEREFYDYMRSRGAIRPRRRHGGTVGRSRVAAVCS